MIELLALLALVPVGIVIAGFIYGKYKQWYEGDEEYIRRAAERVKEERNDE